MLRRVLITSIILGVTSSLGAQPATRAGGIDDERMKRVDELMEQAIADGAMPGAVLLVNRDGRTVHLKAYGNRAVRPEAVPMTVDTVFDLASLTKPIATATSVMLLADRGKIQLSDPVARYIPAFGANGKDRITVAQLLLHNGGLIPDNSMADYRDGRAAALGKIYGLSAARTPGMGFWYTDVGYIVLGEVVGAVDGRPLERFAREEIFVPAGMMDAMFRPVEALKGRCAPTEQRGERWMVGEVHDPRAYALGGAAGHAGLFATARDLERYCLMLIGGGEIDGRRILSEQAVRQMTEPIVLADGAVRTFGFDVDTGYSSARGERFSPLTTFGHTGFTGTMVWIDPGNKCFVVLLAHRVHPDGGGAGFGELRRQVVTLAAEAMLGPGEPRAGASVRTALRARSAVRPTAGAPAQVLCGIDVLKKEEFKLLRGQRVALVTNHTGRDREGNRTVDLLLGAPDVKLRRLLAPEHGLFGVADEKLGHAVDAKTGLAVFSLYGQSVRPTPEMLEGIDALVFDIQDVGARFYTYISTLGHCMEAAKKHGVKMVVLDRPNPITGLIVDGPLADALSFTAFAPIPVAHGMTVGELAQFYNEERSIGCELTVVKLRGWRRDMWFDETGLMWVNPSPNMRNLTQAALYPGICLLETSNVSVGRGTDQPFEVFGAPWIDGRKLAEALNGARLPGLRFVPIEFAPKSSKFANQTCQGVYILVTDRAAVEPVRAGVAIAWRLNQLFGEAFEVDRIGRLLASKTTLEALKASRQPGALPKVWETPLRQFMDKREKHLIYR